MILQFFSEFIWNKTHIFRELLTNKSKHIIQSSYQTLLILSGSYFQAVLHTFPDIKQYWYFQKVTGKQYYKLFQISYHQTILTFSENYWAFIKQYCHIIQYWHFQRVTTKLYRIIDSILTQTLFRLSFRVITKKNKKHFFWECEWKLEQVENSQAKNPQVKVRKVSIHKWNR